MRGTILECALISVAFGDAEARVDRVLYVSMWPSRFYLMKSGYTLSLLFLEDYGISRRESASDVQLHRSLYALNVSAVVSFIKL